ncbi:MAG TPA: hypothetical protein VIF15_20380 [Polyangiaceae bacterium]|jgi:hypothetical protein
MVARGRRRLVARGLSLVAVCGVGLLAAAAVPAGPPPSCAPLTHTPPPPRSTPWPGYRQIINKIRWGLAGCQKDWHDCYEDAFEAPRGQTLTGRLPEIASALDRLGAKALAAPPGAGTRCAPASPGGVFVRQIRATCERSPDACMQWLDSVARTLEPLGAYEQCIDGAILEAQWAAMDRQQLARCGAPRAAPGPSGGMVLGFTQFSKCAEGDRVTSLGDRGSMGACLTACEQQPQAAGCWYLDGSGGFPRGCRVCRGLAPVMHAFASDWAKPLAPTAASASAAPPPAPPRDPCGAAGTWTVTCPSSASACGSCGLIPGYSFTVDVPATSATGGGPVTLHVGGADSTSRLDARTCSIDFGKNICQNADLSLAFRNGTALYDSVYQCLDDCASCGKPGCTVTRN